MKKYFGMVAGMLTGAVLMLVAGPAMARTDVDISIGIPGPVYAQPAPVYVQPQPVYVQPGPVYVQPSTVYVQPRPVYVQPGPVYFERYERREWHEHRGNGWRDRDGDGVPNRWDRHPNNPYRR